jgi:hypothetical protein
VPRSLLREDAKWGRLGALERYAMRRSIRYVGAPAEALSLPVYGQMKTGKDGSHRFAIDLDAAIDRIQVRDLVRTHDECFLVRNFSQRLGFLMRPGAIALVDPRTPVAMGDIAFLQRTDGTADAGVVIGDGIGPLMIKMYNPEEQISVSDPAVTSVLRIGMLLLP